MEYTEGHDCGAWPQRIPLVRELPNRAEIVRILSIDEEPLYDVPCRVINESNCITFGRLPILRAVVDQLPVGVDALVIAGDLQAREVDADSNRLLGEVLAEELMFLSLDGQIPPAPSTGVILSGDLYVGPELDQRGGLGQVTSVWRAFCRHFKWVIGVPGNHDAPVAIDDCNARVLDGDSALMDNWKFAGIGGVIGNPQKPRRRSEADFLALMRDLVGRRGRTFSFYTRGPIPRTVR